MVDAVDRGIFTRDIHLRTIQAVYLRPAQLITFYLMASYLYYHHDMQLMSDSEYDKLCKRLYEEWDTVEHPHKRIIDREALLSTTGYHMRENDYPLIARSAALRLSKHKGIRP